MAYKDYYKILGIDKQAGEKDIKKAYRKLASEFHPDKTKGNKAKEEKFKEISEAHQVLGNAEKRKQYDALGSDWEQFKQSGSSYEDFMEMKQRYGQQRQRGGYEQGSGPEFGGASDFSDIFESLFGNRRSGYSGRNEGFPGADVSGEISVSLQEAYAGAERILDVGGDKIKLKIKPGAYSGLQLRAKGKGQKGSQGRAGDLYVKVRVERHPVFERQGNDLYMKAEIDLFDALLGGQLEVITLSGKVNISIKEGTQNGKLVRLKGKGMPVYGAPGRFGDLFVKLEVRLPAHLSPAQKETLTNLKNSFKEKV
jgi:curved DNA-binding protein